MRLLEAWGFVIAMAFTLFAIPQVSYADQAVDESDALAAADEARYGWVQDESGNWLYYDAQSIMTSDSVVSRKLV